MNNVKAIQKLNETELKLGLDTKGSWHDQYKDSAYTFVGGLDYDLTEGDILAVFSQYGEILNINLVKDKKSGKSKGYCFLGYEDQRSSVLAVDNLNGIKLCGRTIRVDHVQQYRRPKDEHGNEVIEEGCAPRSPPPSSSSGSGTGQRRQRGQDDESEVGHHVKKHDQIVGKELNTKKSRTDAKVHTRAERDRTKPMSHSDQEREMPAKRKSHTHHTDYSDKGVKRVPSRDRSPLRSKK